MITVQCIEHTTFSTVEGYGQSGVWVGGRAYNMRAHRIAFEQAWSYKLKPGQHVLHTCDNPRCINPLHLQLGTHRDNMQDMAHKGRNPSSNRTHCPAGHEYDEVNTRHYQGKRHCRACDKARRAS